eukprot:m.99073 g.99073  ORF g.99073 m.99073 type:complete len:381 (+) comp12449_c0_seq2:255-1397(+)
MVEVRCHGREYRHGRECDDHLRLRHGRVCRRAGCQEDSQEHDCCQGVSATFVDRPQITDKIASYVESEAGTNYMVVIGPRASGKSTASQSAVAGKEGIIGVTIDEPGTVFTKIAEALDVSGFEAKSEQRLAEVIKIAVGRQSDPAWRPTVVAEIDRQATDAVVNSAAKALKRLSTDEGAVHAVLVLSDAKAAFALPTDIDRQLFLWLDDFSDDEAHEFFNKAGFLMPKDAADVDDPNMVRRREIFERIGTRVGTLKAVVKAGEAKIDHTIAAHEQNAADDVGGLLSYEPLAPDVNKTDGKAFERLVRDLLKTTDDVGVHRAATESYLAPPSFASKIFKQQGMHAVLYHKPTHSYRFYSPAHRRAAQRRFADGSWAWPFGG